MASLALRVHPFEPTSSHRIVLAQLEGSGRGSLASYNTAAYSDLTKFMEANPLRDSEAWLSELLRKNEMLGDKQASLCWMQFGNRK